MKRLSYLSQTASKKLLDHTIGGMLTHITSKFPDRIALNSLHQQRHFTYAELEEKVTELARGLIGLGLQPGDRIGVYSPNNYEWTLVQYAAARADLILVNINPAYQINELKYALNKVGCKALVMHQSFKASNYLHILEGVAPEVQTQNPHELDLANLPDLKRVVLIGEKKKDHGRGYLYFDDLLEEGASSKQHEQELQKRIDSCHFDQATNIQFTSGTTGFPKGATLSHYGILNNGFFTGEHMRLTEKDIICLSVPFYHCFGMVLGNLNAMSHGAAIVLPDEGFDAHKSMKAVEEQKCTALYGVPTMFVGMMYEYDKHKFDVSSLRTGIIAGSVCPEPLMRRIVKDLGIEQMTNCYGMTETSPVTFQTDALSSSFEKKVTTVGQVHPHVEAKVINPETGKMVEVGEIGEVCTRGYPVMLGYWNDEENTRKSIDRNGWMHTGDTGVMDEDGYCTVLGRMGDMIIRGGENIYPKEIEDFLGTHEQVQDVQVIGVPDDYFGEVVSAWVILKHEATTSEQELREFCKGKIAHFKIPKFFRFVKHYPLTVTGKVKKNEMRQTEREGKFS